MKSPIWVTWEVQRRNRAIAEALGYDFHELVFPSGICRYPRCLLATCRLLSRRPRVVAVQNPSILLATLAAVARIVFRYLLVVDAHNAGLRPLEGRSRTLMGLARWLQRSADLTIVTNEHLAAMVRQNGGIAAVLPDRLPRPPSIRATGLSGRINVAFVCTFAADEPYRQVLEAARLLPNDVVIHVTGRHAGRVDPSALSSNVKLLGYLPDEDYWTVLRSCDIVLDLTTRDDCLVCGAYEGTAVGKPLILSNTRATREYFHSGCVYVDPEPSSISAGVLQAAGDCERLAAQVCALAIEMEVGWQDSLRSTASTIARLERETLPMAT